MIIKEIRLIDFRSYTDKTFKFERGLNVISGKNAVGKTNLLEGIFMCAIGKPVRANRDKELIKWGKEGFSIKLTLEKKFRTHVIDIKYGKEGKKIFIDGIPILKLSSLIGVFNAVYFSPDEISIIKQSPDERRRFMDISLSQQNRNYFFSLMQYNKILAQRNKQLKEGGNLNDTLFIWDNQLAKYGEEIIKTRYTFISRIKALAKEKHLLLSGNSEMLDICLETKFPEENSGEEILKKLEESREKDIILKYTTAGPHRDDISIKINGVDLRKYGSQGQQRGATLSLKLAEIEYFKKETGEYPVILLDDVLSELDEDRRKALIRETEKSQCILTCTEYDEKLSDKEFKKFKITKIDENSEIDIQ